MTYSSTNNNKVIISVQRFIYKHNKPLRMYLKQKSTCANLISHLIGLLISSPAKILTTVVTLIYKCVRDVMLD